MDFNNDGTCENCGDPVDHEQASHSHYGSLFCGFDCYEEHTEDKMDSMMDVDYE